MRKLAVLLALAVAFLMIPATASAVPPESWEDEFTVGPEYDEYLSNYCGVDVYYEFSVLIQVKTFFDKTGAPARETAHISYDELTSSPYASVFVRYNYKDHLEFYYNEEFGDYDVAELKVTGGILTIRLTGGGVLFKDSGNLTINFIADEEVRHGRNDEVEFEEVVCPVLNPDYVGG